MLTRGFEATKQRPPRDFEHPRHFDGFEIAAIEHAVAQFERDLIVERTRAGVAAAPKRGRNLGPPVKWHPDMAPRARALRAYDYSHESGARLDDIYDEALRVHLKKNGQPVGLKAALELSARQVPANDRVPAKKKTAKRQR